MTSGKNKTLSYDIENRLTQVNELGTITSFTYDGDGGRVRKTTDDGRGTTASVTYVGSLFEIRETTDEGRRTIKHIFAGSNRVCTVTKDEARGTTDASYYHSDHLGSSSIITDASGQQVEHYEYTPYGTTAVSEITSRPSSLIHHKFTGKELDSTGLYFYGARYYDPEVGRFITADTIVQAPYDPQSLNRYAYCRNNPINYIDPSGHIFWFAALIIAAVVGAGVGAAVAAATGGDIGVGAITGAISGALFWGAGQAISGIATALKIQSTAVMTALKTGVHAFTGAASGALGAVATGGDVGFSTAISAISAGASAWVGGVFPIVGNGIGAVVAGGIQRTTVGAILGGGVSLVMGGSFGEGAAQGAMTSAIAYLANDMMHKGAEKVEQAVAGLMSKAEVGPTKDVTNTNTNSKGPGPLLRLFGNIYKAGGEGGIGRMLSFVGNVLTPSGPLETGGRILGGGIGFLGGAAIGTLSGEPIGTAVGAVSGAYLLGGKLGEMGRVADETYGFSTGELE